MRDIWLQVEVRHRVSVELKKRKPARHPEDLRMARRKARTVKLARSGGI